MGAIELEAADNLVYTNMGMSSVVGEDITCQEISPALCAPPLPLQGRTPASSAAPSLR